jgi:predicted nucleic acid-binding protein
VIFFDTNVLIYFSVNQDEKKQKIADNLILAGLENNEIIISPLVLIEYLFVLSKLKQIDIQQENINFFKSFSTGHIDTQLVLKAFETCSKIDCCININDLIHLKFAELHCNKLVTFDSDFEKLKADTHLEIEILK